MLFPTGSKATLERRPYVVYSILGSLVFVQVCLTLVQIASPDLYLRLLTTFGFIPARKNFYALVTSLFIHASWIQGEWLHLVSNALYLWIFGAGLENRIGHWAFGIFYITAGICAGLIQGAGAHPLAYGAPLIGASGAVAGILGAYLVLMPFTDIRLVGCCFWWPVSFHLAAFWFLPIWFLLEFVQAQWSSGDPAAGIAYWAHVGGFLVGIPVGVLVRVSESTEGKVSRAKKKEEADENIAAVVFQRKHDEIHRLLLEGNFSAAWFIYARLQEEFPGVLLESDCQLLLGREATRAGKFREALGVFRDLANSNRTDEARARAAYQMGVLYLDRLADRERAARVFQLLIGKFPHTDSARGAEERLKEIFPQG